MKNTLIFACTIALWSLFVGAKYSEDYYLIPDFNIESVTKVDQILIDSCLNVFHNTSSDTMKIKVLSHLCNSITDNSWTKYQVFNYNLIKKTQLNSTSEVLDKWLLNYLVEALNNLSIMETNRGNLVKSIEYGEKSLQISLNQKNILGVMTAQSKLAHNYLYFDVLDSAESYFNKSFANLAILKDSIAQNLFDFYLHENIVGQAQIDQKKGNVVESIENFTQAATYYDSVNDPRLLAICYSSLGLLYAQLGEINKSINLYNQSVKIQKTLGDEISLSATYSNLGDVYLQTNEYDIAIEHYSKSLEFAKRTDYTNQISLSLNNIGRVYFKRQEYHLAEIYYRKSLKIDSTMNNLYGKARAYYNLGMVKNEQGETDEALKLLKSSLSYYESSDLRLAKAQVNTGLAKVYLGKKEYGLARKHAINGHKIAIETKNLNAIMQSSLLLYKVYDYYNEHEKALEFYISFRSSQDSLLKVDNRIEAIKQEFLTKEKEETYLNKLKIEEQKAKANENKYLLGLTILIVITLIIILLWRRSQYNLKIKWLQEEIFKSQMKPHFIFNVLVSIQLLIVKNKKKDAIFFLSEIANFMRTILKSDSRKHISLKEELDLVKKYLDLETLRFGERLNYSIHCAPEMCENQFFVPPMILQPIVENSIVHGFKDPKHLGQISIECDCKDKLIIRIKDNGAGFNGKIKESLGLSIVRKRLKLINNKNTIQISHNADNPGVLVSLIVY